MSSRTAAAVGASDGRASHPTTSTWSLTMTTPATFRRRPAEIEAVQWTDTNADALTAFAGQRFMTIDPEDRIDDAGATASLIESAHESWALMHPGDWAVKRGNDFAVLTPEEFADLYEPSDGIQRCPQHPDAYGYEHPSCGFHWHGRDGMDVPLRDGEPVCPRCELRRMADEAQPVTEPPTAGPPCGNNPNFRLTPGDQQAVDEFKAYLAERKADETQQDGAQP